MTTSPTVGFARLPKTGLIEVRARYGGRPGTYLLDSGSVLDVVNAQLHPFETGEEVDTTTLFLEGEPLSVHTYEAEEFAIGRYLHEPRQVIAVDLPYSGSDGTPVHGLLGHPLFRETPIGIDWDQQSVTFGPLPSGLEGIIEVPLEITEEHALVLSTYEGDPMTLQLETAANFGVLFHNPAFDPTPFQSDDEVGTRRFTIPRLGMGTGVLQNVNATHDPMPDAVVQGRIGLGVLSKWNLWIDYPAERMWLIPR